jgi:AraC-like DNA-binding protein
MLERFFRLPSGEAAPPWQTHLQRALQAGESTLDFAAEGLGEGSVSSHANEDALVSVIDGRLARPMHMVCEVASDLLLVRAALSSDCDYAAEGAPVWRFRRPEVTVSALPRGTRLDIRVDTGAAQRSMTMLMQPSSLLRRHGVASTALPEPLRSLAEGRLDAAQTLLSMPVSADIGALVRDLAHSRLSGPLRSMQVQARAAELLALVAASWNERLASAGTPGTRGRDGELASAARRILCERFADPPTLRELARELGTNKNKLNQLFRVGFGVTPQAFCLQRRMERAQALIMEGRLNVGQVADEVGYQHQSSFAVAFRDVIGVSPREFARSHRVACGERLEVH